MNHILYETGDEGVPTVIQDRNGEVALGMCKVCGAAEIDLIQYLTCEEYIEHLRKIADREWPTNGN